MTCGISHRYSLDPALLWQWHLPAAIAPIRPLAWELPYAAGEAEKEKKNYCHIGSQGVKQLPRPGASYLASLFFSFLTCV